MWRRGKTGKKIPPLPHRVGFGRNRCFLVLKNSHVELDSQAVRGQRSLLEAKHIPDYHFQGKRHSAEPLLENSYRTAEELNELNCVLYSLAKLCAQRSLLLPLFYLSSLLL